MQVKALTGPPRRADPFAAAVERLVDAMGKPAFEHVLMDVAAGATRCSHVTAFVSDPAVAPCVVLAANRGPAPVARAIAGVYLSRYWGMDPANTMVGEPDVAGHGTMMRLRSEDIGSSFYRSDCYTGVRLSDRLSLIRRHDSRLYRLNFYCDAADGFFDDGAVAHVMEASTLLLALIGRHHAMLPADRPTGFTHRLRTLHPDMPAREVQVCDGIARGLTSEGIALDIGIALNTVLTYRRRAYARLGISSQNELLHRLLAPSSGAARPS